MNQVQLYQQPSPALGFDPRQTSAEANYFQAMAHASADPRATVKQFDRAGLSRGRGQYSQAAAIGAQNYAQGMAQAERARMSDAYAGAGLNLEHQGRQQDFGMALAGLQQQAAISQQNRAMDFSGNVFNQMQGASPADAFKSFGKGLLGGLGR